MRYGYTILSLNHPCCVTISSVTVSTIESDYKLLMGFHRLIREQPGHAPSMQEQREPQAVELIWDLWVEEWQQAAHVIHAVHLGGVKGQRQL